MPSDQTTDIDHAGALRLLASGASWQCQETAALLEDAADEIERLRAALEFYADAERYNGPNQRPIPGDQHQPDDLPYRLDVTRDHGQIARKALGNV